MTGWDDLTGQEAAIALLREAATDPASMTHAWLITGPPGSGRSNLAFAFATELLTPQPSATDAPAAVHAEPSPTAHREAETAKAHRG